MFKIIDVAQISLTTHVVTVTVSDIQQVLGVAHYSLKNY